MIQVDPGSAYLGALVTLAIVLALLVAGAALVAVWCHRQAAVFLGRFRTMRLERVGGQVQVTAAVVEGLQERQLPELGPAVTNILNASNGAPPS